MHTQETKFLNKGEPLKACRAAGPELRNLLTLLKRQTLRQTLAMPSVSTKTAI